MLFIVTPFSRPQNFEQIKKSIFGSVPESDHKNIHWYLIVDGRLEASLEEIKTLNEFGAHLNIHIVPGKVANSVVGHDHRNQFIDIYKQELNPGGEDRNDWMICVDDDTLLHPDLYATVKESMQTNRCAIVWSQDNSDGTPRLQAAIENVKVCHIDMGSYMVNLARLPLEIRFRVGDYCADGHFIEDLINLVSEAEFTVIPRVLSVYNQIRDQLEVTAISSEGEEMKLSIEKFSDVPVGKSPIEHLHHTDSRLTTAFDSVPIEKSASLSVFDPNPKIPSLADCPVPCLQVEAELQAFLKIFAAANPKNVVEIGSFYGGTLWFFSQVAQLEKLTSIDLPIPASDERYLDMMSARNQWIGWVENVEFAQFIGDSHDGQTISSVKEKVGVGTVDVLHIDGDHTYEGVRADYDNYKDLVRPGGMIVFHDVVGITEVAFFWSELVGATREGSPLVTQSTLIKTVGGMGIGILYV